MRMLDAQFTIRDRDAKLRGDLGGWTHIFQKNFIAPRFFLRMECTTYFSMRGKVANFAV